MDRPQLALLVFTALTSLPSTSCDNVTDAVQATLEEHTQKLNYLESIILQQSSKLSNADAVIEELTNTVDRLQSTRYESLTPLVAFDVHYSDDPHHNVNDNDVMIFDDTSTNFGNAYDATNGTFKAPVSGVYVFQMKVTPSPKGQVYAYLIINDQRTDSVNANDPMEAVTGESLKIVKLKAGDDVWMRKSFGENSVRGWVHTKFSGFLLRATTP